MKITKCLASVGLAALLVTTGSSCSGNSGLEEPLEEEGLAEEDVEAVLEELEADAAYSDDAAPAEGNTEVADDYGTDGPSIDDSITEDYEATDGLVGHPQPSDLEGVEADDVASYNLDGQEVAVENDSATSVDESRQGSSTAGSLTTVTYIAKPGDSLAIIAHQIYGDANRWQELAAKNGINDPSKIFPGDVISYEADGAAQEFTSRHAQATKQTVTVQAGDTLSGISQRLFGSASSWKYLWRFNQDAIRDPNLIKVGQILSFLPLNESAVRQAQLQ